MKVDIISYRRNLLDKDNLYGGVKPLIDAMKNLGMIKDDKPDMLELDVRQERRFKNHFTEINIRPF